MAHLSPEFRYDAFVSYSHGDVDGSGNSPLKTWSTAFAQELQAELKSVPGLSNSVVFLDQNRRPEHALDPSDPLTAQLHSAATGAAILLILMSPHYLRSGWCRDERTWWLEQTVREAFPEIGSRIFVGRIWPTRDAEWPKELCDERGNTPLGVWFHDRPGDEFRSRPFGWPNPTGEKGEFRAALVELAGHVAVRLNQVNEALARRRQGAAEAAKLAADGGQAIYVHARAKDKTLWEEACHDLIGAGYGVFPDAPEEDRSDATQVAESEIVRTISACDGLLLVPGEDPRSLVSDLAVIGHQRRNSAKAMARKPLPCAVVDRGFALDAKPRLQQSARNLRIDWIDGAIANWTNQVKTWLTTAGLGRGAAP